MSSISPVSDARVIAAMREAGGIISLAARMLDVDSGMLRQRVYSNPVIRAAFKDMREDALDLAEGKLLQAIRDGDMRAIMFFLRTQGRHRGYGDKLVVEGTGASVTVDLSALTTEQLNLAVDALITRAGGRISMNGVEPVSLDRANRDVIDAADSD